MYVVASLIPFTKPDSHHNNSSISRPSICRPELIDPAMLRPGRLDKLLYVPLPTAEDRASILRAISKNASIGQSVDIDELAKSDRANGYSGADLSALLREAGLSCLRERLGSKVNGSTASDEKLQIEKRHFDSAFDNVLPSVSKEDQKEYDNVKKRISRARSRRQTEAAK